MSLNFLRYKFSCGEVAHRAERSSISSGVSSASATTRAAPPSLLLPFHWASWWQTCLEPCDAAVTQPADLCYPAVSVWDDNNCVVCRKVIRFQIHLYVYFRHKKGFNLYFKNIRREYRQDQVCLVLGAEGQNCSESALHNNKTTARKVLESMFTLQMHVYLGCTACKTSEKKSYSFIINNVPLFCVLQQSSQSTNAKFCVVDKSSNFRCQCIMIVYIWTFTQRIPFHFLFKYYLLHHLQVQKASILISGLKLKENDWIRLNMVLYGLYMVVYSCSEAKLRISSSKIKQCTQIFLYHYL